MQGMPHEKLPGIQRVSNPSTGNQRISTPAHSLWYTFEMDLSSDVVVQIAQMSGMGWLRSVGSVKLQVSCTEYSRFYRALLQKRPLNLSILLAQMAGTGVETLHPRGFSGECIKVCVCVCVYDASWANREDMYTGSNCREYIDFDCGVD